ncbi:unnamed protein product [Parnassius apollo]|uniref:(apollo) hypothetical protein n=1 Tax=Parnassius apollo TaxID=110799 RepID=A0A8S3XNW6_PARAO|nr:unnamed protein product [Parnassius apollo]CAG5029651.1 unnamed protein product [Parnassius apollo]
MKFFIAFALLAVASASVIPAAVIASDNPEIQEIVAAIQSPSTDPATAAALEELLLEILGIAKPEPIDVGPAIVDNYEPIAIGPAVVDFPLPDGGAVADVNPTPVMPAPVESSASAPLVQIILNIQSASDVVGSPVSVETVQSPAPTPVQVVDEAVNAEPVVPVPVIVVDKPIVPEPVIVVDTPIVPEPVIVVEEADKPETVVVAQPIIPAPAIVLPEILN